MVGYRSLNFPGETWAYQYADGISSHGEKERAKNKDAKDRRQALDSPTLRDQTDEEKVAKETKKQQPESEETRRQ